MDTHGGRVGRCICFLTLFRGSETEQCSFRTWHQPSPHFWPLCSSVTHFPQVSSSKLGPFHQLLFREAHVGCSLSYALCCLKTPLTQLWCGFYYQACHSSELVPPQKLFLVFFIRTSSHQLPSPPQIVVQQGHFFLL